MQHRIHVICIEPEICTLIKKALSGHDYIISCNTGDSINEFSVTAFKEIVDCVIIDNNIDPIIKKRAKEAFRKSSVIYLPSLTSAENSFDNTKDISVPLKLSELTEKLEDLFKLREEH